MEDSTIRIDDFNEDEAIQLKRLICSFIQSYTHKDKNISDEDWLKAELHKEIPNLSDIECEKMAKECIQFTAEYDDNLKSIHESAKKGQGKENWFMNKVMEASAGMSVQKQGEYLNQIDQTLMQANAQMVRTVTTKDGAVSQCMNLDGYIAEQYHVNTFNANAGLKGSNYYAEVKVPGPNETYGKNSFDIVIKNRSLKNERIIHQYQAKYGSDAKATIQLLKEQGEVTKYSNQTLLVPPEQVEEIQKAFPGKTVVSQIGGTEKVSVTSNSLTKKQAKELQTKIQENGDLPASNYNNFKNKDLAFSIGKNAAMAGMNVGIMSAGINLAAQAIQKDGIDFDETLETALKAGTDAGIKHAVAGALKAASEKNILRMIPPGTPIRFFSDFACMAIENIKIMKRYADGEYTATQTLEMMGRTTLTLYYGLYCTSIGIKTGSMLFSFIPIMGPILGGFLGGIVGYIAGSTFGEKLYNGSKILKNTALKVYKSAWIGIKSIGNKIKNIFA